MTETKPGASKPSASKPVAKVAAKTSPKSKPSPKAPANRRPAPKRPPELTEAQKLERAEAELRERNQEAWSRHDKSEVHGEVPSLKGGVPEVHAFEGRVVIDSHGEAVLDMDGVIQLKRLVDAALQAVA